MKKTEGEIFWAAMGTFQRAGYSATAAKEIAQNIIDGKDSVLPPLKDQPLGRPLPLGFKDYLRPFIKDDYGEEQVEIDMDAIVQFLQEHS